MRARRAKQCSVCGVAIDWRSKRCPLHRTPRQGAPVGTRKVWKSGYAAIKTEAGWRMEHVDVMERHLGRALLPGESVHHKNLQKADNRLENLELWTTSQPPGARVGDLVIWAREILALYAC